MFSTKEVKKHLQIPLKEILLATDGFAEENRIAKGGFGNVYKGVSEEHGQIAVKRWDRKLGQGDHEFRIEIAFHSEYKHENIASFVGFCDEDDEKILVYEYESNGSLDKHLDNKNLTWVQRVQICIGVAKGLEYCHNDIAPHHRVLHRDVKSSNILLDENLKAKVSDFGLSKITPANVSCTFLMSAFCGTFGYIDPDYFITGYLTQKSDVYSLGIVLFEVLCGRLTHVTSYKDERQFLKVLVQEHYKKGTLHKIVHPELRNQIKPASLLTFTNIAYQCLKNVNDRPLMNQVVKQLQKALDDQLAPDGDNGDGLATCYHKEQSFSRNGYVSVFRLNLIFSLIMCINITVTVILIHVLQIVGFIVSSIFINAEILGFWYYVVCKLYASHNECE